MQTLNAGLFFWFACACLFTGCKTDYRPVNAEYALSSRDLRRVEIGMPISQITKLLKGGFGASDPILVYEAKGGGIYCFFFMSTKEVQGWERNPGRYRGIERENMMKGDLPLVAVARLTDYAAESGIYVLPKSVKGKRYTGLAQLP